MTRPAGGDRISMEDQGQPVPKDAPKDIADVLMRVFFALKGMQYGEVIVKVQGGRVIWVDRYERERVG